MNLEDFFYYHGNEVFIVFLVLGILAFIMSFITIIVVTINLRKEDNALGRLGLYGMIFSVIVFILFIFRSNLYISYDFEMFMFQLFYFALLFFYPISLLCMTISMKKYKLCFSICILCIVLYLSLFCLYFGLDKYYFEHFSVSHHAR